MSKARVFWEINWDGKPRTREGAWREARRLMRAGRQVILEQVWLWSPREGFPNGLRLHVGRWEAHDSRIVCSYRFVNRSTRQASSGGGYGNYRKWMKSYGARL